METIPEFCKNLSRVVPMNWKKRMPQSRSGSLPGLRVILAGREQAYDVLTERTVQRPIFNEPRIWEKPVTVNAGESSVVNFLVSSK
jgi:hypothetical protein